MSAFVARQHDRVATLRRADPRRRSALDLDFARNRYRVPKVRRNYLRNSRADVGSVVGVISAGGLLPTNWIRSAFPGLSHEVVAIGTDGLTGLPYVDVRISGTNSSGANAFPTIGFDNTTAIEAAPGQAWFASVHIAKVAGSFAGFTYFQLHITEYTSGGAFIASSGTSIADVGATLARRSHPRTMASGARAWVRFDCQVADGQSVDLTLRLAAPQMERDALTDYIETSGAARTVVAGRRAGHHPLFKTQPGASYTGGGGYKTARTKRGLLIPVAANELGETDAGVGLWEVRTNVQLRSDPLGAVAGSPGTLPTGGWGIGSPGTGLGLSNGVTRSVAGVGIDQATGLPYVDFSFVGTFTANENVTVIGGTNVAATAAAPGQVWTASMSWAVVGGVLPAPFVPSINGSRLRWGSPGFLQQAGSADVPNANMANRQAVTSTAPASTSTVGADWLWSFAAGQTVTFTIRLAGYQLELGSSASPYIPVGAAAVTRPADILNVLSVHLTPPFALYVEYEVTAAPTTATIRRLLSMDVGSNLRRLRIANDGLFFQYTDDAGALVVNMNGGVPATAVGVHKAIIRVETNNFALCVDGGAVSLDVTGTASVAPDLYIASNGQGSEAFNDNILRVSQVPPTLTAAEMQAMTAA